MTGRNKKISIALMLCVLALNCVGCCRRGPSQEPPKYYQRELARMEKEARKKAEEEAEKNRRYEPDGYPWRSKKDEQHFHCTPCRIKIKEECLSKRIAYLTEFVHGKKKCRIKFRD